jgi:hypothetical protein
MLFRRRVITPATPTTEREVVVVRPRRPASLYAALGVATLCAVGLIGYMTYALYNEGQMEQEPQTTAVIIDERTDGRAQRIEPANKPPQTIIVNPPPVIQMTPPAPNPPPVKQQDTPIIVNGAPQTEEPAPRPQNQNQNRTEEDPPETIDEPPADPE